MFGCANPSLVFPNTFSYTFFSYWGEYFITPYLKKKYPLLNIEYKGYDESYICQTQEKSAAVLSQILQFEEWYQKLPVFPWWKRFYFWNYKFVKERAFVLNNIASNDFINWFDQSDVTWKNFQVFVHYEEWTVIYFKRKEDAVFFKMRFGEEASL